MIQDLLKDLNKYVTGIGSLPAIRVNQTESKMELQSISPDKQLVVFGFSDSKFSTDETTFGMGQLDLLQKILDCPEYEENAVISLGRDTDSKLSKVDFSNPAGDFTNSYRLMSKPLLDTLMPEIKFLGSKWNLELAPSLAAIKRFNLQAAANSDETSFIIKLVKGNLEVSFGTPATHSGKFIFAEGVNAGKVTESAFPVAVFQKVLNLTAHAATATIKLTEGLMCVEMNSGLITYHFFIPALSK